MKQVWLVVVVVVAVGVCWWLRTSDEKQKDVPPPAATAVAPAQAVSNAAIGSDVRRLPADRPASSASAMSAAVQPSFVQFKQATEAMVLAPDVRQVVGLGELADNWYARAKALDRLPKNLSRYDIKALLLFCDLRYNDYTNVPIRVFNAVKNDVIAVLLHQDSVPREVAGRLVSMYRDRGHDEVWRDYCIQYWAQAYDILWGERGAGRAEDPERAEVKAGYGEALQESGGTLAGTALLGMERLSAKYTNDFDRSVVLSNALTLATAPDTGEPSRLSLLH